MTLVTYKSHLITQEVWFSHLRSAQSLACQILSIIYMLAKILLFCRVDMFYHWLFAISS